MFIKRKNTEILREIIIILKILFQHKFWFNRTGVSVIAVAPFYIDTPFIGEWKDWTPDPEAQKELEKSAAGKKILR